MIDTSRVDKEVTSERVANQRSSAIKIVPYRPITIVKERTRKDGKKVAKYTTSADLYRIYCSKILAFGAVITYHNKNYRVINGANPTDAKHYYYYEAQLIK